MEKHGVVVSTITRSDMHVSYVEACLKAQIEDHRTVHLDAVSITPYGPYLDDARNLAVQKFLNNSTAKFLLFVDSDIGGWNLTSVASLISASRQVCRNNNTARNHAVVGGLYLNPNKDGKLIPVAYHAGESTEFPGLPAAIPVDAPTEIGSHMSPLAVDAIGTGFMLIPRELLEDMDFGYPTRWFAEQCFAPINGGPGGIHWGEDLTFCARVLSMGGTVHLHRGVRPTHAKTLCLVYKGEA